MTRSGDATAPIGVDGCVVLPPSVERQAWVDAIRAAADGTDWRIEGWEGGPPPVRGRHRLALIVTDAGTAAALAPAHWAVITTATSTAASAAETLFRTPPGQGVWVASRLLAAAWLVPDTAVRVTDRNRLSLPNPLVLLPGLTVTVPMASSGEARHDAAATALDLYSAGNPQPGTVAHWPVTLFSFDLRKGEEAAVVGRLDLTGRPRILVYGPYIALPPGVWRARIRFAVDAAAARRRYRLEWGDLTTFAEHRFTPGEAGLYELSIDHDWTAATPSEVRLILIEGAIDGTLEFMGLEVERLR